MPAGSNAPAYPAQPSRPPPGCPDRTTALSRSRPAQSGVHGFSPVRPSAQGTPPSRPRASAPGLRCGTSMFPVPTDFPQTALPSAPDGSGSLGLRRLRPHIAPRLPPQAVTVRLCSQYIRWYCGPGDRWVRYNLFPTDAFVYNLPMAVLPASSRFHRTLRTPWFLWGRINELHGWVPIFPLHVGHAKQKLALRRTAPFVYLPSIRCSNPPVY
ncbi:hypothetical protein D3C74_261450 [compost metagenome]